MTNVYNYSTIQVDARGVRGVISRAMKNLRREGFFSDTRRTRSPGAVKRARAYDVHVIFVAPGESAKLNLRYRKKNKPTNVLSFDYGNEGEIIVCPHIVKKEARAAGHSVQFQTAWMIIHGLVHLAGVHHESSPRMSHRAEVLEEKVLYELGIGN